MNFDLSLIQKTDILPLNDLVGLGKKHTMNTVDCIDCDNCYENGKWKPSSGIDNDCNCDTPRYPSTNTNHKKKNYLDNNCDCYDDFDCSDCDCDYYNPYDEIPDCYWNDDGDWYPGGWDALCGDPNCDCDCDCYYDNCGDDCY